MLHRIAIPCLMLAGLSAACRADVVITSHPGPLEIESPVYTARVEGDGCLTSLRVGGAEFLAAGVSISRGSYFFQGGALRLSQVEQLDAHTIAAESDAASVRYQAADQAMSWSLQNRSSQKMVFFLVFSGELDALESDEGDIARQPITQETNRLTCYRAGQSMTVTGLTRVWGPWEGPHQVAQIDLEPHAERVIQIAFGVASPEKRNQILQLSLPEVDDRLTLWSPRNYQVFQRRMAEQGELLVSGRCGVDMGAVGVRLRGDSLSGRLSEQWHPVKVNSLTGEFHWRTAVPAGGWYALDCRVMTNGQVVAELTVDHFGVGEVFVGAGQSNSTNCGQFKTRLETGMVASFSGQHWQLADDPQPGAADRSQGGSFWPAFGDAMYRKYRVPIGVAVTGFGGTSVNQWQPDDHLFNWMLTRIHQLGPGGFRALLWHQGESDVGMPSREYYMKLRNTIVASKSQAGWEFPWFVAQASYHNPQQPRDEGIRDAQSRLWADGMALEGPDTDELTGDHRDFDGTGIHLSPKGLRVHGELWAERVSTFLDQELADGDHARID